MFTVLILAAEPHTRTAYLKVESTKALVVFLTVRFTSCLYYLIQQNRLTYYVENTFLISLSIDK